MQRQGTHNPLQVRIDAPIGSGPFQFGQYRPDVSLQLAAKKNHFATPKLDELWIVVTPSIDTSWAGWRGRDRHGRSRNAPLSPSQIEGLKNLQPSVDRESPGHKLASYDQPHFGAALADYEFRRAWMSLDREYLVDVPSDGGGRVPTANTFLVEGNPWNNPDLPTIPHSTWTGAQHPKGGRLCLGQRRPAGVPPATDQHYRDRVRRVPSLVTPGADS